MERKYPKTQRGICAAGLTVLALLFLFWLGDGNGETAGEFLMAVLSVLLFSIWGLRFVPQWFSLWFGEELPREERKGVPLVHIFAVGLGFSILHVVLIWLILRYVNPNLSPRQFLDFWQSADAYHYLCIARDWYIPQGDVDRVVQLVFLPGYPLAVRLMHFLVPDYILSGMLVSAFSFAGALCVIYRLVLLDHDGATALRTVLFLCLMPGAFFFTAPMSESFFLLLSGISLAPLYLKDQKPLYQLLKMRSGIGGVRQILSALIVHSALLMMEGLFVGAVTYFVCKRTGLIGELQNLSGMEALKVLALIIPVVVLISLTQLIIYEGIRSVQGSLILIFMLSIFLGYFSGCLYPISFFPEIFQKLPLYQPVGASILYIGQCLLKQFHLPALCSILIWCLGLFGLCVLARERRIRG